LHVLTFNPLSLLLPASACTLRAEAQGYSLSLTRAVFARQIFFDSVSACHITLAVPFSCVLIHSFSSLSLSLLGELRSTIYKLILVIWLTRYLSWMVHWFTLSLFKQFLAWRINTWVCGYTGGPRALLFLIYIIRLLYALI
jgi:hypothetical protein